MESKNNSEIGHELLGALEKTLLLTGKAVVGDKLIHEFAEPFRKQDQSISYAEAGVYFAKYITLTNLGYVLAERFL
ncbi:hypothetical protein CL617_04170 [archaeon]|nr:hypothetical protein [archaeon]|tara:strand:+ start:7686 stop:7913 length:228 start_codon:yes stop_codon:yes gene_type:complete